MGCCGCTSNVRITRRRDEGLPIVDSVPLLLVGRRGGRGEELPKVGRASLLNHILWSEVSPNAVREVLLTRL